MHVLSSFQRTGSLGGTFPLSNRVFAVNRRTHPEYRTPRALSTPFSVPPSTISTSRSRGDPSRQPLGAALSGDSGYVPTGLRPQGLAGLGCRPPGASKEPQLVWSLTGVQAAMPRCKVTPVRPARLSRLAEDSRGVNPHFHSANGPTRTAPTVLLPTAPPSRPAVRVSGPAASKADSQTT